MVIALLLAATLSANPAAPAIGRDGRVNAPEGFRAQLPAGFRYVVAEENGYAHYRAVDPSGKGFVSVAMGATGDATQCTEAGEVEAQPGVRVQVTSLRTRSGLEGCLVRGRNEQGAFVLAFVYGPERDAVMIAAIAMGPDKAERQARAVADTVAFSPRPPIDPRLVGCFTREGSSSVPTSGLETTYFVGVVWTTRCFLPDRRFVEKGGMAIQGAKTESVDAEGRWSFRAGRLEVVTEGDSWRAAVEFEDGDLLLDGKPWTREADPDETEEE